MENKYSFSPPNHSCATKYCKKSANLALSILSDFLTYYHTLLSSH